MKYTELQVTSNFSFLRGASHPHELVEEAKALAIQKLESPTEIHLQASFVHIQQQET